ncbi:50S ribosomal protein L18 [Pseudovibrio sp. W64]|jgi:large subunit ribosomal protein L18|uniref:Large ribosomal subunit protein uL18 n=1 Tax=Pseudovibrio ascidiaceicola TaxID=285279 RepID=A0A1I4EY72_9HYPH|nr:MULTISPECIES: 50S ribosomal protein L18 [Pseudovibrio]KZK78940.1 50S ribosomal protein L18 [Pseudovibrio sp. Ad46]KZK79418.1 50S ribosomal protein L18 [Pseudovibrio sp. W64]KZK81174.1 50S ribosomal protein L18 [Pseudovibrio sp. Ad13]KZK93321.1 50S ribosomal protein L18 [Pseudovibrio sp. Ad5]KZL00682.1 50S ribosomal protein L18 [Pseudovibrio sp. W74]
MANGNSFERRRARVRRSIKKVANGRPRLSVFRSSKQIYAQIIDDTKGVTLASASTIEKDVKVENGGNKDAAAAVGKLIAERAIAAGIKEVVFDRGGYIYHGRVQALADAARDSGLSF